MPRRLLLLAGLAAAVGGGCGPAPPQPPATHPVSGSVTLDGRPLADGSVQFVAAGWPAASHPVAAGQFAGGAPAGRVRVVIQAFRKVPVEAGPDTPEQFRATEVAENYLPARYNDASQLEVEVTSGGPNEFKFELTSSP